MSEELKNKTENGSGEKSPYDGLSDMADQFDPEKAKAAREEALEAEYVLDQNKQRTAEYAESSMGKREKRLEDTFDEITKNIDEQVKAGKITQAQLREIAEYKMPDLNANDVEGAMRIIAGTARNMGIEIEGEEN